jgi:hypothetical protein
VFYSKTAKSRAKRIQISALWTIYRLHGMHNCREPSLTCSSKIVSDVKKIVNDWKTNPNVSTLCTKLNFELPRCTCAHRVPLLAHWLNLVRQNDWLQCPSYMYAKHYKFKNKHNGLKCASYGPFSKWWSLKFSARDNFIFFQNITISKHIWKCTLKIL